MPTTKKPATGDEDNQRNSSENQADKTSPASSGNSPGATAKKSPNRQAKKDELFDYQPTSTTDLPPVKDFVESLVPGILEAIHGLRETRQLGRWLSHGVYEAIEARATSIKLRNQTLKEPVARPQFALGNVIVSEPRDGVCEAAAVVHGPTRVRAVALRLEGLDRQWKATSFRML